MNEGGLNIGNKTFNPNMRARKGTVEMVLVADGSEDFLSRHLETGN